MEGTGGEADLVVDVAGDHLAPSDEQRGRDSDIVVIAQHLFKTVIILYTKRDHLSY